MQLAGLNSSKWSMPGWDNSGRGHSARPHGHISCSHHDRHVSYQCSVVFDRHSNNYQGCHVSNYGYSLNLRSQCSLLAVSRCERNRSAAFSCLRLFSHPKLCLCSGNGLQSPSFRELSLSRNRGQTSAGAAFFAVFKGCAIGQPQDFVGKVPQ